MPAEQMSSPSHIFVTETPDWLASLVTRESFLALSCKKEQKKKNFFFEKKKQKTFVCWAGFNIHPMPARSGKPSRDKSGLA
jgi:hypothetical protein